MSDEVVEVGTVRQMPGKRCGGIEHDDHHAGLQQVENRLGDLADRRVRHGQNDHVRSGERGFRNDTIYAEIVAQACAPCITHFNVTDIEAAATQITGQPMAHFATGTKRAIDVTRNPRIALTLECMLLV